nr:hypothetical protein [Tanacetum cinerariifolium]
SKREKRKREDGGSTVLGPGGWESEEEEVRSR